MSPEQPAAAGPYQLGWVPSGSRLVRTRPAGPALRCFKQSCANYSHNEPMCAAPREIRKYKNMAGSERGKTAADVSSQKACVLWYTAVLKGLNCQYCRVGLKGPLVGRLVSARTITLGARRGTHAGRCLPSPPPRRGSARACQPVGQPRERPERRAVPLSAGWDRDPWFTQSQSVSHIARTLAGSASAQRRLK